MIVIVGLESPTLSPAVSPRCLSFSSCTGMRCGEPTAAVENELLLKGFSVLLDDGAAAEVEETSHKKGCSPISLTSRYGVCWSPAERSEGGVSSGLGTTHDDGTSPTYRCDSATSSSSDENPSGQMHCELHTHHHSPTTYTAASGAFYPHQQHNESSDMCSEDDMEVAGVTAEGELLYRRCLPQRCVRPEETDRMYSVTQQEEDQYVAHHQAVHCQDSAFLLYSHLQQSACDDEMEYETFVVETLSGGIQSQHYQTKERSTDLWMLNPSQQMHVQQLALRARDRENDMFAPYVAAELEQWQGYRDVCAQQVQMMRMSTEPLVCLR